MNEEKKESIFDEMERVAAEYSQAKANAIYLTEFRKSKKAILMKEAESLKPGLAGNAQEREAYSHHEYKELLLGLREATEMAEAYKMKWEILRMYSRWVEGLRRS